MNSYIRYWLPVFLWLLLIFTFSSHPTGAASHVDWQDFSIKKTAHMVEYGTLTVFVYRALINTSKLNHLKALVYAFLFAVFYGATDEYHQSFTPGREPTVRDVIFDTIGAGIASLVIWKYLPKAPKKLKKLAEAFQITSPEVK